MRQAALTDTLSWQESYPHEGQSLKKSGTGREKPSSVSATRFIQFIMILQSALPVSGR